MSRKQVDLSVQKYISLLVVVIGLLAATIIGYALWSESLATRQSEITNGYHLNSIRHSRTIESRLHYVRMFINPKSLRPSDPPHQQISDSGPTIATSLYFMRTSLVQLKTIQETFVQRAQQHVLLGATLDRAHDQFTRLEDKIRPTVGPKDSESLGSIFNAFNITMAQLIRLHTISYQREVSKAAAERTARTVKFLFGGGVLLLIGCLIVWKIMKVIGQITAAQRKSEIRFRNMFESSKDAVLLIDPENDQVRDANKTACQLLKYSKEELLSTPIADIFHDSIAMFHECVGTVDKDCSSTRESTCTTKTGEVIPVEISLATLIGETAPLVMASARNVLERQKMQAELNKSLLRYQSVLDAAPEAIITVNETQTITEFSKGASAIFGYSPQEVLGKPVGMLIPDNQKDSYSADSAFTAAQNVSHLLPVRHEIYGIRKSGELFPTEVSISKVFVGSEWIYTAVFHDITERRKLEKKDRQTQKMEAIGQLAGGIAHDFNNILAAIFGHCELLAINVTKNSELRGRVDNLLGAAERARNLVKQILAFSRQGEDHPKPIMIGPIIMEILSLLRASLPSTIEIRPTVDPACGLIVADPTQIHQVVMNLCTNAEYAMRGKSGVLELALRGVKLDAGLAAHHGIPQGHYAELRISDTGRGMDPEIIERIFDPFFTTKGPGEGTGMGLSVIHGIVKRYGGAIAVESKMGEGTVFDVLFPLIMDNPREDGGPSDQELLGGTERILFIDDEPAVVELYKNLLEKYGYSVVIRTSSIEAVELFRNNPDRFDVVVTDQTMPSITGYELAQEILLIRPGIPIILCTGYSATISPEIAKSIGIREYVMKPVITRELTRIIRKIFDQPHEE